MRPKIAVASAIFGDTGTAVLTNYTRAAEAFGGAAFILGAVREGETADLLRFFDGLILAGGGDVDAKRFGQENHPLASLVPDERDSTELTLARAFCSAGKPILGVCRGAQVLNVALGGDLCQHIPDINHGAVNHNDRESFHAAAITDGGILRGIFPGRRRITVNSTHHQAINRPAPGFVVTATADDGIIEAIEMGRYCLGVQWHPERMLDTGMARLWEWFLGMARKQS